MFDPVERPVISTHDQNLPRYENLINESNSLSRVNRVLLTVASVACLYAAEASLGTPQEASATTGGYPDWNKACVARNDPQYGQVAGAGYWCDAYRWGVLATGEENSPRGYGYRNCTDWVAFRIPQLVQKNIPWRWGNAKYWDNNAAASGYVVDGAAEPGDVAVWNAGTYGHVEVVESVNSDGSVNTSGYNKRQDGNYGEQRGVRADVYIDLNGTGKGIGGGSTGDPEAPPPSPYPYQNVTVMPNILGGISLFAASGNGLLGYKDQLSPGGDLQSRPWGTIPLNTKSHPELVRYPNGALSAFTHGMDNRLYHSWQYGPGTGWAPGINLSNITLRGEPSAALNPTGGVSVFFADINGELREIDQIGQGGDISGMPVHNLHGNVRGKPAVVNAGGKMAVFAQGLDGYLKTNFQLVQGGSWSGWLELGRGQKIKGDPKVLINRLGGMTVMAIGESGDIVGIDQTKQGGDMNKPFYSLGKPFGLDLVGTPAIVETAYDEQMVFATSAGGALYHKGQMHANNYAWSGYYRLGGSFAGAPTAIINALDGASVFGRSPEGTIITADQPGYGAAFNTTWAGVGKP